jgi:predicted Zn-dependent peptidase
MEFFTLRNGLRVVLFPVDHVPLVAVNLWYAVGSKDEKPGKTGFAHLFEHLMFEGSRNVRHHEHFEKLEQVGGVANGSTWVDHTNYYETLSPDHLELALFLESNRMGYLLDTLEQGKLDGQRSVVKNERRWRVDNRPYGIWDERLYEMAFPEGHPYHHPVIGYMEDLNAATLEDVEAFFKTYYVPSNAVLTVAGRFSHSKARELIRKYFGPIPSGERSRPRPIPAPALPKLVEDTRMDHVALPRLYLLFYGPAAGGAGCAEAEAAQYLLGEGRGSLLYRELVLQRSVATSTSTTFMPAMGVSTMVITVTGTPGSRLEDLKAAAFGCLDSLLSDGIPPEDARRARNRNLSYGLMQWESLTQKANLLSEAVTHSGDPEAALRKAEQREKVSQEGLTALLDRMMAGPPVILGFVPAP